ncbi:unnamed protein product [Trifolium pratense]|uniref:Uncharacterized protein n=1 Tax=Trifolium pratense TaxID=57577 RepID=A0ACB0ILR1_TRIPR|nr:unnamed protein product [Trifolium pratense]
MEKKKPRPKNVFGCALPTEEEFEVFKNAPSLTQTTRKYVLEKMTKQKLGIPRCCSAIPFTTPKNMVSLC